MFISPTMQPNFFNGIGPQNTVSYIPLQTPVQNNVQYPEIIGEGDVASVVLPNGSVQYFFIPTIKRDVWPPCAYALPSMNVNWNIASHAWFIRNISNPIAPSCCFSQQYLKPYGDHFNANIMPSECIPNSPALAYSNTFHYDRCTSSSDLQFFSPRSPSRPQQTSAAPITPTEHEPMQACLYDLVCANPCPCVAMSGNTKSCQDDVEKEPAPLKSAMSIEEMDRKCCCACPTKKTVDKSVSILRDSASEENNEEIAPTEKCKVLESSKMKVLGKKNSISTIKSEDKNCRISRKSSHMEVIKTNKANQYDSEIIKSMEQKSVKSEKCRSDIEKLTDELKPKKQGRCEKEQKKRAKCCCQKDSGDESDTKSYGKGGKPCCCRKKRNKGVVSDKDTDKAKEKRAKCCCQEDSGDESDTKSYGKGGKPGCCCIRRRNKGVVSDKDTDKAKDKDISKLESGKQLSLIQIVGRCDQSCCCGECAAK